jgi:sialidase-1
VPFYRIPPAVFTVFSDDHGVTWRRGRPVPIGEGGDEAHLAELPDGRILMDFRQTGGPHRWLAESTDGGETWSRPWPGINVSPVACAMERISFRAGSREYRGTLWTGPSGTDPAGTDFGGRWGLTLRTSFDGGRTFSPGLLLVDEPAGYSDLTILRDGTVGILWEGGPATGNEFITFTRLTPILRHPSG